MPQLEFADYMPQLVWLAITFAVLYLLMSRVALPTIARVLDDRGRQIEGDLAKAEQLKAEAAAVQAAYNASLAEARAAAQAALQEAGTTMAAEAAEREARFAAALGERTGTAERRIAAAKRTALGELPGLAAGLVGAVAAKLTGLRPSAAEVQAAVETAFRERR